MIFLTGYLNEPHGAAKSAVDFLKALAVICDKVDVVCPRSIQLPIEIAGRRLAVPSWHKPNTALWSENEPQGISVAAVKKIYNELLVRLGKRRLRQESVIVNSWASKALWESEKVLYHGTKAIIVRESPRHFSENSIPTDIKHVTAFLNQFDYLIFVSEIGMREWAPLLARSPERLFYLPNCIEEEAVADVAKLSRSAVRQKFGFDEEDIILVYPATVEHRKGHDLLLDVYDELIRVDAKIKIFLVGGSRGAFGQTIDDRVRGLSRVVRIGALPSALECLYLSDILIFPSRAEAMPRTILEAMAFGRAVVASAVDGIPELIVNGETGFLFNIDDPARMVDAVKALVESRGLMGAVGARAQVRYYKNFCRSKQIERLEPMVREIQGAGVIGGHRAHKRDI